MFFDLSIPARSIHDEWMTYYGRLSEDENGFPVAVFGRDSYCAVVRIETNRTFFSDDACFNVLIGKYTSMGYDILMEIDPNHDYMHTFQGEPSFIIRSREDFRIRRKGQIFIGNDCWIGARATIISGAKINNGAVIGAGAVVTGEIPPYAIAVGNPAKVVKYRFSQEIIDGLQRIQWWNWPEELLVSRKDDLQLPVEEFVYKYLPETVEDRIYSACPIQRMSDDDIPRFLYYIDFDQPYPLADHVISEFVKAYHKRDAELVLYCSRSSAAYDHCMKQLWECFDKYPDADSLVNVVDEPLESDVQLITQVDAYITNRTPETIRRCEIAARYGKKILSGVDRPIFV
ncbi:virginiamycin A acetyltransferase [Lachnospiraceae bacterium]|nr:virginiamycin A acetyltransferase [Lachnospiraceae bacterium]